jgi:hypothetical protein
MSQSAARAADIERIPIKAKAYRMRMSKRSEQMNPTTAWTRSDRIMVTFLNLAADALMNSKQD